MPRGYDGGMAEEKKRFGWWLVLCAVLAVLLAAVLGLVETVGRQGTIVGRFQRIEKGMAMPDVVAVLGVSSSTASRPRFWGEWKEGPVKVTITLSCIETHADKTLDRYPHYAVEGKYLEFQANPAAFWWVRRWAEQAYTAIHGPRR
jgi:hypothetical protein